VPRKKAEKLLNAITQKIRDAPSFPSSCKTPLKQQFKTSQLPQLGIFSGQMYHLTAPKKFKTSPDQTFLFIRSPDLRQRLDGQ
jgi:hypothetical protein